MLAKLLGFGGVFVTPANTKLWNSKIEKQTLGKGLTDLRLIYLRS